MTADDGLVVFGAGGHGRVVMDAAQAAGARLLGFLDDRVAAGTRLGPWSVLGDASWLEKNPRVSVVVAIGDNQVRERLSLRLSESGRALASVVHPRAVVSPNAVVKPGAVVLALAVVNAGATVGYGAVVNTAAVVEHDVVLGDFAHVSPNATLGGGASLGRCAHLGLSACVLPGKSVGDNSVVGAGAVVTRDIAASSVVAGVPARPLVSRQG